MVTQELLTYIKEEKRAGRTNEEILRVLRSAGWGDILMHIGFDALQEEQAPTSQVVLEALNISKIYQNGGEPTHALRDVNLKIIKGESLAIIGKSGSGKSTLMHILATLDRPTNGDVRVDTISTSALKQAELDNLRNRKIGFVFQQFFVNGRNTCLENVTLPLMILGLSAEERNARGLAALESVGLSEKASNKANDLSGGQKQRLCIARALITQPEIIFADEPTGNLDTENGNNIVSLLFQLQKEKGITLIIVTHDEELAALCDRSITIKDGMVVEEK